MTEARFRYSSTLSGVLPPYQVLPVIGTALTRGGHAELTFPTPGLNGSTVHDLLYDVLGRLPANGTTANVCATAFRSACEPMRPAHVASVGNATAPAWDISFADGYAWSVRFPFNMQQEPQPMIRIIPAPVRLHPLLHPSCSCLDGAGTRRWIWPGSRTIRHAHGDVERHRQQDWNDRRQPPSGPPSDAVHRHVQRLGPIFLELHAGVGCLSCLDRFSEHGGSS
jgi:hypothetical protein